VRVFSSVGSTDLLLCSYRISQCKAEIASLLDRFSTGDQNLEEDLATLASITSEVQAINNQAAILHGERIKKAQTILTQYQDGAFSAWLIATYGNRQTPYNLLQYYEFYVAMPTQLRTQIETMPRQAIYTLASREGTLEKKQKIVESYNGETKQELINLIRETFPLDSQDGRQQRIGDNAITSLKRLTTLLRRKRVTITRSQKQEILQLITTLEHQVHACKTR